MLMERTVFMNSQCPKLKIEDPEIDKIAEQIRIVNAMKMVQLQKPEVAQTLQQNSTSEQQQEIEKPLDWNSIQGHFGWEVIGNENMPYIFREDVKFVSDRMTNHKLLQKFKLYFVDEIFEYLPIKMVKATLAEARLLTEINVRHCDKMYGMDNFTEEDLIFPLDGAIDAFRYLKFCYKKLKKMDCYADQRCGFIKINKSSLVPYVLVIDIKFVPLFYFEGDCEHLEKYAVDLKDWDLAYLKFVCKIQGIRRNLYDKEVIAVVDLEHLKKFFLPGTEFEICWDIQNFSVSDFQRPSHVIKELVEQRNANREAKKANKVKVANTTPMQPMNTYYSPYQMHTGGHVIQPSNVHPSQTQQHRVSHTLPQPVSLTQPQRAPHIQQQQQSLLQHQRALQPQQGVMQQRIQHSQQVPIASNRQRVPAQQQQRVYQRPQQISHNLPNFLQTNAMLQSNCSNVYQISEVENRSSMQYFMSTQEIDGKLLVGCINSEPFNPNVLLVTLQEIARSLFQMDINVVKSAVNAMGLDIFLPNTDQMNILRGLNLSGTDGLINLKVLYDNLAQIKYILGFK